VSSSSELKTEGVGENWAFDGKLLCGSYPGNRWYRVGLHRSEINRIRGEHPELWPPKDRSGFGGGYKGGQQRRNQARAQLKKLKKQEEELVFKLASLKQDEEHSEDGKNKNDKAGNEFGGRHSMGGKPD
jgi:hypothetical protein